MQHTVTVDTAAIRTVVKRRTRLVEDRLVMGEQIREGTRTMLDLGKGPIYAISAIYKNGTAIVAPTNYTWSTYASRVTLAVAAVDADEFLVQVQAKMSDTAIDDFIGESADVILSGLRSGYDDAGLDTLGMTEALIAMRTVGKLKIELCKGSRDNTDFAEGAALVRESEEISKAIRRGEMDILDSVGAIVGRRVDALAGGFRNTDGEAIESRLQVVDRLQRWYGLAEYFWPEVTPAEYTSPRVF